MMLFFDKIKQNNFQEFPIFVSKSLIFWILLFNFQRLIFSIFHYDIWTEGIDFLGVFLYSFRLDLSAASYLTVILSLFALVQFNFQNKITKLVYSIVFWTLVFISTFIHASESIAYFEWNHKLSTRVFTHLSNPDEIVRTASFKMIFGFLIITLIELSFASLMYNRFQFFSKIKVDLNTISSRIKLFSSFLITLPILFLFMRGGLQQIPINIDAAYYSKNQKLNDVSVNSTYFFGNSFLLHFQKKHERLVPEIDENLAKKTVAELYDYDKNHTNIFLENRNPNIVFIILESWTANAIGCLSSQKKATPNFDDLAKEGVLFTNIYAVNTTSEIGNTAILSGFPGIPEVAISLYPEKHRKLKSINQILRKDGYVSSYLFGGDLKYGNIQGFIAEHGFDEVLDEKDFPKNLPHGKLSYHDEDLFHFFLNRIYRSRHPFMHCVFTGSTHAPYDYPDKVKKFSGIEADFMNAIFYSDKCLGDFFKKAKKQSWYKNTLFVLVADHSHGSAEIPYPDQNQFFKIPLLFFGEPIKKSFRGKRIDIIGSQTDIVSTLLHQMSYPTNEFPFSKDLMSPNAKPFAFHAMVGGYGFVDENGSFLYHFDQKNFLFNSFSREKQKLAKQKSDALYVKYYEYFKSL